MSYGIEIAFLALMCKYFHVPSVIPAMDGCFFWIAEYLLITSEEEDAPGDKNNPLIGRWNRSQKQNCLVLLMNF